MATGWLASLVVTARRFAKPCPERSSSFFNVKHATSTASHAVDEVKRGVSEMVVDVINKIRCRNSGGDIYKYTSFTLAHPQGKVPQGDDNCLGRAAIDRTRVSRIFLLCRKETKGLLQKMEDVSGSIFKM